MLCGISCNKNLRGFPLIFCLKHLNSNRCFDCFPGTFNAITGILGKFLRREKNFILYFGMGFEYTCCVFCTQKYSPRGIIIFFKISRKIPLMELFSKKLQVYKRNPPWVLPRETASFDVFLTPILSII